MRSVYNAIKALFAIRPGRYTTTQTGAGVDTFGYNSAALVLEVGTVSGTTPTLDVKVQDSADNSSFADVSGLTLTQITASNNSQILQIDGLNSSYNGVARRRYLRVVGTIGGTTPSFDFGAELLLGRAFKESVN
jgi:hypothetical protein